MAQNQVGADYFLVEEYSYDLTIAVSSVTETPQPKFVEFQVYFTSDDNTDVSEFVPSEIIMSDRANIEIYTYHLCNFLLFYF